MRRFLLALGLAAVVVAALPTRAAADPGVRDAEGLFDTSIRSRQPMLSLLVTAPVWNRGLKYYDGIGAGLGMRLTFALIPEGFIPKLNDSFELEFGGDLLAIPNYRGYNETGFGALGLGGVRYAFYITSKFDAYARASIGIQYNSGPTFASAFGGSGADWIFIDGGVGAEYKFAHSVKLRAEVASSGFRFGFGFLF